MNKKSRYLLFTLLISLSILMAACSKEVVEEAGPPPELPADSEPLVMLAKFDLSIKTGENVEGIVTKSVEETLFDDSSLGVPQPGGEYEAVITPGYIIMLEVDGESYEYRASGAIVVQVPKEE